MKRTIAKAKIALMYATDGEWYVLVAVCAIVAVFLSIMTGHVQIKY